jgi:hypothetical protein
LSEVSGEEHARADENHSASGGQEIIFQDLDEDHQGGVHEHDVTPGDEDAVDEGDLVGVDVGEPMEDASEDKGKEPIVKGRDDELCSHIDAGRVEPILDTINSLTTITRVETSRRDGS